MYSFTLTVQRTFEERSEKPGNREAFWSNLKWRFGDEDTERPSPIELENSVSNNLPHRLSENLRTSLQMRQRISDERIEGIRERRRTYSSEPVDLDWERRVTRIAFRVLDISYGSLKVELGIPDVDSLLDLLGNNSELFEALLEEYAPEAFAEATDLDASQFRFSAEAEPSLVSYARERETASPTTEASKTTDSTKGDARQQGAKILAEVVRSPLIFPVVLVLFLWYIARQDVLAERQILSGLMQSVMQQQTATLGMLRDVAVKQTAEMESARPGHSDAHETSTPKLQKEHETAKANQ